MDQHGPLRLLAVESATAHLSVALLGEEGGLVERALEEPGHHAEHLLGLVDALLAEAGCRLLDVTAFAISIGPGSFTSLRVGLASVKGLAVGTAVPVVAVPTLEALAFGARVPGDARPLVPLLDARRGEMYAGVFEPDAGGLRTVVADGLFAPEELAPRLPAGCRLVGEGVRVFGEALRALAGEAVVSQLEPRSASAADVARLALPRLRRGEIAGPDLAPRYVRRAEAEAKRTRIAVEDPA